MVSRGEKLFAARARLLNGDEGALGTNTESLKPSEDEGPLAERVRRRNGGEIFLERSSRLNGDGNLSAEV